MGVDPKERTASLAPPSLPASADRGGRDFTLAIHLSAVGGGDAGAKETEQRLEEGKRGREDGDREGETKMRNGTQIARLSFRLWVCAPRDSSPGAA